MCKRIQLTLIIFTHFVSVIIIEKEEFYTFIAQITNNMTANFTYLLIFFDDVYTYFIVNKPSTDKE